MRVPGVSEAIDDIRAIADGMRILPELARILTAIQELTESLDDEVRRMREGVDKVSSEVTALGDRLELQLVEVQRTLRPLERVAGRMRISRRRQGNGEGDEIAEPDAA